jgi:hypothetical protein
MPKAQHGCHALSHMPDVPYVKLRKHLTHLPALRVNQWTEYASMLAAARCSWLLRC